MFSKNIILLFCVVCYVQKCASVSTEDISTVDINEGPHKERTDEWKEKFKKFDGNGDGFITAEELQKLLFEEFSGFVTVGHANKYISLTTLRSNQIGFEQFKHMKPLIAILSKKENSENNDEVDDKGTILKEDLPRAMSEDSVEVDGEGTISKEDLPRECLEDNDEVEGEKTISRKDFLVLLWDNFQDKLFEEEIELFEILDLIGFNEDDPIELKKLKEIEEMFEASVKLNKIYKIFCLLDKDSNRILTAKELVVLLEIVWPTMATIENATVTMTPRDKNSDGTIDFPKFSHLMLHPGNEDQTFIDMFCTARITRKQLNTYFYQLYGERPTEEELDRIDPLHQNSIPAEILINV